MIPFLQKALPLFLIFVSPLCSQIHVLMTSAVIPLQYDQRKEEYLRSFNAIKSYGFEPWVVESTTIQSSFFDEVSYRVLYPQTNNLALRNKGVNEVASLRASLDYLPFQDEDIVIKLTGRYHLYNRFFIHLIEENHANYDVFASYGKHFVSKEHIFTGCFAMRWKYLKKIISEMDFAAAEADYIPVEKIFADFIQEHSLRIKQVDSLHVSARIFFSGEGTEILDF